MGILVLLIGFGVLGFGLWNHLKGKRILSAPFKGTGDLAANPSSPDPKGAISTEGAVQPPREELLAPCSETPCLYYEVKIERLWEKVETTQDGTKTVKGSDTLDTVKGGALVALDDGTGGVEVDFSKGADFDSMKETFKKELNGGGGSSHVQFGHFTFDVPVLSDREKYTIGFRATEKSVPAEGNLFVLGKLEGSRIVKPGWRAMMASSKGREGLLGSIQKKKKFSFIGGGIVSAIAIPIMIFAPSVDTKSLGGSSCSSELVDAPPKCSDNVSSKSGDTFTWKVTQPGQYQVKVHAPAKKVAFAPEIVITGADGKTIADETMGIGSVATTVDVGAGEYKIVVKPGDGYMVKGGFSYELEITSLAPAAPAAVADVAPPAEAPAPAQDTAMAEPAPEAPAKTAKVAKGKTKVTKKKKTR